MSAGKQKKVQSLGFTKEEELLMQDFSRNVSVKSSALFYANAFIISSIPIWLFLCVHNMDLQHFAIFFVLMTPVSTFLMAFAYRNIKFQLKHKIAMRREDAVRRELNRQFRNNWHVILSRKDKDESILWKKNEVADCEATTFSIFYNNALFLAIVIFLSFFLLKNSSPAVNYILSIGIASGGSSALFNR